MKKIVLIIFILLLIIGIIVFKSNNIDYSKSIVEIKTITNDGIIEGHGFVYKIEKYAYILTNYHVIKDYNKIYIYIDDSKVNAKVLNCDEYEDLAILLIDKKYISKSMNIGNSNNIKINDKVKIGNNKNGNIKSNIEPFKFSYDNQSKMMDVLKIDSNVNVGDSGSPVLHNNKVIGIVMMKDINSDISYALPINDVMNKVRLLESNNYHKPNLGISATSVDEGVLLNEVYDEYPANVAGLKGNDIIVKINDNEIHDTAELRYFLYKYKLGDNINIGFYRNGEYLVKKVLLNK